ncbi:hypothetical protein [Actinokineospora sp. NBRC 105648]|uniref:hypothetical protein n=1 Tax=Actinokineospora sp. NBRC 105648 TaxID=3032206 RepID=UPI0025562C79|nr:hypothetical protein [Actinokineospora sp. NBRC 105648]
MDELRDRLLRRQCTRQTRDAVWAHLVSRSRTEGATWTVACVGMALPALASTARWLAARYRGDRADVHAAVLSGFVEALTTVDLAAPGVMARLRWTARRVGQAALEESLDAPRPTADGFGSTRPRTPWGHPDLVLAQAVARGVLTRTEADLIGATRLEGVSVAEWAQAHEAKLKSTYSARERAEDRLVEHLRQQALDTDPTDTLLPVVLASITLTEAAPTTDPPAGTSLAVSGRRRNGGTGSPKKPSRSVQKEDSESGLLPCAETPPTFPHTRSSRPTPEVPPWA